MFKAAQSESIDGAIVTILPNEESHIEDVNSRQSLYFLAGILELGLKTTLLLRLLY